MRPRTLSVVLAYVVSMSIWALSLYVLLGTYQWLTNR